MNRTIPLIALASAMLVARAAAAAPSLDIRSGLWELNSAVTTSGDTMSPGTRALLDTLSPAQRASIMAAISAEMADAAKGERRQVCMTPEQLDLDNFDRTVFGDGEDCQRTVISRSSRRIEQTILCKGDGLHSLHAVVEVASPEAISGRGDGTFGPSGRTSDRFTARFIATNCPAGMRP